MSDGNNVRVGIVAADPLGALGLEAILQECGLAPVLCDLHGAIADGHLAALVMDDHGESELIDTLGRLRRERPDMKLMVLGDAADFQYIQAVVGAGARGYLLETAGEAEIRMAMEVVLDGSVWAPRKVLARLIDAGQVARPAGSAESEGPGVFALMTPREREVLALLIHGQSNREIGNTLGIDEVTVKAHLGRMLRKTRAKNRVELTLRALEERVPEPVE